MIIVLPGYSYYNKDWAYEVKSRFVDFKEVLVVEWAHWSKETNTSREKFVFHLNYDLDEEIQKLKEVIADRKVSVIAKSVGTMIASKLAGEINIDKVVLCGIPSTSEKRFIIMDKAYSNFPVDNIIVFQNKNDPFSSYKEISDFMQKINPGIKVVEKPASDHNYPYIDEIVKFIRV